MNYNPYVIELVRTLREFGTVGEIEAALNALIDQRIVEALAKRDEEAAVKSLGADQQYYESVAGLPE